MNILLRVLHSAFRPVYSQMVEVSATGRDIISEDIKKSDNASGGEISLIIFFQNLIIRSRRLL